jgi:hypothetical protein
MNKHNAFVILSSKHLFLPDYGVEFTRLSSDSDGYHYDFEIDFFSI